MAFPVFCFSPFSNIHITLSAQASICLCMCVCDFQSVRLGGLGGTRGFPQRGCLDIAVSCLTELSGMLRYGDKKRVCTSARLCSPTADAAAVPSHLPRPPHLLTSHTQPPTHALSRAQGVIGPQRRLGSTL